MIPWEVLKFLSTFCCLSSRYTLSITCRSFSRIDWKSFHTTYCLDICSKSILKRLIKQDYNNEWSMSVRLNTIWLNNLNKPLVVWSPWTTVFHGSNLFFREFRFLNFIRNVGLQFKIKTRCIQRYNNEKTVRITIWPSSRVSTYIIKNNQRKKRSSYKPFLNKTKKFKKMKVLIQFNFLKGHLKLCVQEIEFFVF